MNVWETAIPYQGGYGITRWLFTQYKAEELTHYRFDNDDEKCCLIGASLANKMIGNCESMVSSINKYFNLQPIEVRTLISGFDEDSGDYYSNLEGYIFANQVAKIIFNESE